jgi:hypothetical protein
VRYWLPGNETLGPVQQWNISGLTAFTHVVADEWLFLQLQLIRYLLTCVGLFHAGRLPFAWAGLASLFKTALLGALIFSFFFFFTFCPELCDLLLAFFLWFQEPPSQ